MTGYVETQERAVRRHLEEVIMKKLQVKLFKTLEALAIDAGHTIKVVGYAALNIVMHSGYRKG